MKKFEFWSLASESGGAENGAPLASLALPFVVRAIKKIKDDLEKSQMTVQVFSALRLFI